MIDNSHERINVAERIKQQSYSLGLKPPWDPRTSPVRSLVNCPLARPFDASFLFAAPVPDSNVETTRFIDHPWSSPLNHYDVGQVSPGR